MTRFNKMPQVSEGKIIYHNDIIDGIVFLAVREIPYIELDSKETNSLCKNSAIKVRREKGDIHIDVNVKIHYSQNVSDMAFKIQESIRHNLEAMTEYRIASVNVNITGVNFDNADEKFKSEEKVMTDENDNKKKLG